MWKKERRKKIIMIIQEISLFDWPKVKKEPVPPFSMPHKSPNNQQEYISSESSGINLDSRQREKLGSYVSMLEMLPNLALP